MGRDNPITFNLQDLQRPAEEVVSDALGWMSTQPPHPSKPFFVWIHLYDPHTPYDPPARFRPLLRDPYDGEIAYADDSLGKFFAYLKEHRLYDSTLIIAASDHGESFGEHGEYTHRSRRFFPMSLMSTFILARSMSGRAGPGRP